jgi:4'-phosphopantetheinyl transferase
VTRGQELGVDLEVVRPMTDAEGVARRFFSAGEVSDLLGLPERELAFFRCWTRKEAYIKALGQGLSCPLDRFRVSLLPAEPPRLVEVEGSTSEARQWTLWELIPWPGHVACIAIRAHGRELKCYDGVV